jgi:hypothetical protein
MSTQIVAWMMIIGIINNGGVCMIATRFRGVRSFILETFNRKALKKYFKEVVEYVLNWFMFFALCFCVLNFVQMIFG